MNIVRNRCAIAAWILAALLIASAAYMMQMLGLPPMRHLLVTYAQYLIYSAALWLVLFFVYPRARTTRLLHIVVLAQIYVAILYVFAHIVPHMGFPVIDAQLTRLDRQTGISWLALDALANQHKDIRLGFVCLYLALIPEIILLYLFLAWRDQVGKMWELFWLGTATALACIAISAQYPAVGVFGYYGLHPVTDYMTTFQQLFEGLRGKNIKGLGGHYIASITCFPSFQAALATAIILALRGVSWIFWPVLTLNLCIILSAIFIGGHYLSAVGGGVLLALVIFIISRFWRFAFSDMERG